MNIRKLFKKLSKQEVLQETISENENVIREEETKQEETKVEESATIEKDEIDEIEDAALKNTFTNSCGL